MIRVTAPGLPPHPRLMFDPKKRWAKVSVRHPTWQSEENAILATVVIVLVAKFWLVWMIWHRLPLEEVFPRLVVTMLVYFVSAPVVACLLSATLQGFLARQVFPKRTTLWVTPKAIAFRSHLYARPVIIWREWNGLPVRPSFLMHPNGGAERYKQSLSVERAQKKSHLNNASLLVMVLATTARDTTDAYGGKNGTARVIPITDIHMSAVAQFTMVFSMALQITAPRQESGPTNSPSGIDIDAA